MLIFYQKSEKRLAHKEVSCNKQVVSVQYGREKKVRQGAFR